MQKVELFFTPASGGEQRSLGAKEFTEKEDDSRIHISDV